MTLPPLQAEALGGDEDLAGDVDDDSEDANPVVGPNVHQDGEIGQED